MKSRMTFPAVAAALFGVCCLLIPLSEVPRVFPQYQSLYLGLKFFFAIVGLSFAFYFRKKEAGDLALATLMICFVFYCIVFMWLMPLYEAAYLQVAIGSAFFKIRRKWLFPVIYGFGLAGIYLNYYFQSLLNWQIPSTVIADWIWVVGIFFLLSWLIQKYAIGNFLHEEDRLSRFSLVGEETAKLTHDLKGLLSSPLLIIDHLKGDNRNLSVDQYRQQMILLAQDMSNIEKMIKSIQRLVIINDEIKKVSLNEIIGWSLTLLERRLQNVQIVMPVAKDIDSYPNRLHSVFFNLFLNSLEAFQRNKIENPIIEMKWKEGNFIYQDNAGGFSLNAKSSKGSDGGLGLNMVRNDLIKIGAKLKVIPDSEGTTFHIRF